MRAVARDPFELDARLPWEHVSPGESRGFLEREWRRALAGITTADCTRSSCTGCGICPTLGVSNVLVGDRSSASRPSFACGYAMSSRGAFATSDISRCFTPLSASSGAPSFPMPSPRAFHPICGLVSPRRCLWGTASDCEWYDVFLTELVPPSEAFERLKAASPVDLAPVKVGYVDVRAAALTAFITCAEYAVNLWTGDASATESMVHQALEAIRAQGTIAYLRGRRRRAWTSREPLRGIRSRRRGGPFPAHARYPHG